MYFFSAILGIIQCLLIGFILLQELKKKSPVVFLWATLLVMFSVPHVLTVITEDMAYDSNVLTGASFFVSIFSLFYIACRKNCNFTILESETNIRSINSPIQNSLFEVLCTLLFFVSIAYYIYDIIHMQGGLFSTSWSGGREIETSYISIKGVANYLLMSFSGLSLYFYLTNRRKMTFIVLLTFIFLVAITRNRVQLLPVLIFFITLFLIRIRKIKIRHLIVGAILAVITIYIVYAIRAVRWLGTTSDILANISLSYVNTTVLNFVRSNNGELGLRQYFYYFIEQDNQFIGFNRGATYVRMLLVYFPSKWTFGIKPQSFDLTMGQAVGMGIGGSMHPTLFGDCFGNFYWFGMLLGVFWSEFANVVDKIIVSCCDLFFKIMLYFLAAYAYVVIARGSVYNGFVVFAWGAAILFLLYYLGRNLQKKRFVRK